MMKLILRLLAMLGLATGVSAAPAASVLTPQDQEDITALISQLVWGGFETREEISEAAAEAVSPTAKNPADLDWIKRTLDAEWTKKRAAEASWPARTDCDRLDEVFEKLRADRILALPYAGNTQSDARDDAIEAWHQQGGETSGLRGFVFYHGQDIEGVLADGILYIGYAAFPGSSSPDADIAAAAVEALRQSGFSVVTPPNPDTRIKVTGVDWKHRGPR